MIAESSIAEMLGPGRLELSCDDALELLGPTAQFARPDPPPGP
ncbi:MAG: hypothetical protein AB7R55_21065 [Gemmatimonadales bacterium]